ncbi:hypothetical protein [Carboxylicivirga sp. N1Y90]|uniref:hypothetical protein n=1 Tax=Carboxylicivirga fragile TaxID=3417571 RepID=UPI003D358320|nr:hypothetical protein [Marinilabiliaceae bacterium N1Y90]
MITSKTPILLFCILLLSSCAVQHKTLPKLNISYIESFHLNETDSLYYGYFKDLLALTENSKLKQRWAKRKNYQIIGFEVMNTSESFTKGFQLKFYHNNERIIPLRNEWIAKKARQKVNKVSLIAYPMHFIELCLFPPEKQEDEDGFDTTDYSTVSLKAAEMNNEVRKKANSDLLKDLQENDISHKVLPRGLPVYGIIIIEGNIPLDQLQVKLK